VTQVIPDGQEIIPDGAVDMEYVIARAAAFAAISERYGEQAPRSGLPWAVEDVTPDGQGSPVFQYSAEDWVVTVSCMVTIPDGCTFHVLAINETTGFRWEGEVDTGGGVTEKPTREPVKASEWVLAARDAALAYLADQYGDQAPPLGLTWREAYTTPEGWVGSGDFEFTAEDWVIAISYPIVPPERTIYQVTVMDQITGFQWEGKVDATGQVIERDTTAEPVVDLRDPGRALHMVLAYLNERYAEQAPEEGLLWIGDRPPPEEPVDGFTIEFTSEAAPDWVLTVSWKIEAPEAIAFQVVAVDQATGFQWEGEVDAAGQVTEISTAD
jgi:hypothetical protein